MSVIRTGNESLNEAVNEAVRAALENGKVDPRFQQVADNAIPSRKNSFLCSEFGNPEGAGIDLQNIISKIGSGSSLNMINTGTVKRRESLRRTSLLSLGSSVLKQNNDAANTLVRESKIDDSPFRMN